MRAYCRRILAEREKSLVVAKELRIAGERIYDNYRSMAAAESKREDKIDAVCGRDANRSSL